MITHWWCMVCADHGTYEHTADGESRAKGTPYRHTLDTTHPTMTSIHPRPTVDTDDVRFHD